MDDLTMPLPFHLEGRVAIVTGGGAGIGAAITRVLAAFGADVVIGSRKLENLQKIADEVGTTTGRSVLGVAVDVRDDDACSRLVEQSIDHFGRVDVLVNNAGGSYMFPFLETAVSRFDAGMDLNLRAPYVLTQAVAPHMIAAGRGAIVNVSSVAGVNGLRGGVVYSAAKAGLQMMTRVIAAELGPKGVRCNAIAVGETASDGAVRAWKRFGQSPESIGRRFPLRRVGRPEDIAWGVLYLASDMSSWVTGETLVIAGGPVLTGGLPDEA